MFSFNIKGLETFCVTLLLFGNCWRPVLFFGEHFIDGRLRAWSHLKDLTTDFVQLPGKWTAASFTIFRAILRRRYSRCWLRELKQLHFQLNIWWCNTLLFQLEALPNDYCCLRSVALNTGSTGGGRRHSYVRPVNMDLHFAKFDSYLSWMDEMQFYKCAKLTSDELMELHSRIDIG